MTPPGLHPEPLSAEGFAPFGTLVGFDPARARLVNAGTAHRADTSALFDAVAGARPGLAFYRAKAQALPLPVELFERHPAAAQTFVALDVPRFLVVVAPAGDDGRPLVSQARAFLGRAGTGVSYRTNQWHAPILALDADGDFVMVMAEFGDGRDCVEQHLDAPLLILEPRSRR